MSETATAHPPHWAPWRGLLKWAPFKIDALGLVTLLGADEVNASVGRLIRSRWLEYLPLLGSYVIAGNRFREKETGFHLYNISQGIHTTDLASWLSRWIKSQHFTSARSFVRWTIVPPRRRPFDDSMALMISISLLGFLFALTILQYDLYGMGSTLAMAWSVLVRWFMVSSVRETIDRRVSEMCDPHGEQGLNHDEQGDPTYVIREEQTYEGRMKEWRQNLARATNKTASDATSDPECWGAEPLEEPHRLACGWKTAYAKTLIVTSEALAVTMMIPTKLMGPRSVFNANLSPRHYFLYGVARWTGWIAFAVQVVTIGQADLVTQICTVALLVIPTVLHISKFGCDDSSWTRNCAKVYHKCMHRLFRSARARPSGASHTFSPSSVSRIGSRLVAEVYEWPLNHDFVPTDTGGFRLRRPSDDRREERIARRQWLYAWLQLSDQEFESMDKWDLFPHGRDDHNKQWFHRYLQMQHLISTLSNPVGTISGLTTTPILGAQDITDAIGAVSPSANGGLTESPTSLRSRRPIEAAPASQMQEALPVLQNSYTEAAIDRVDEETVRRSNIMQHFSRTPTVTTTATKPPTIRERHRRSESLTRHRHSVHAQPPGRLSDDGLLGSGYSATNMLRQQREEQLHGSDSESVRF